MENKLLKKGLNCIIEGKVNFGKNVSIGHNCILEDGVTIGDDVFIDNCVIVRNGTTIGSNSYIGSNCIIGEKSNGSKADKDSAGTLAIGHDALIRSSSIIYSGSIIGNYFQTGHRVTIREKSQIGDNVSVGTLSDIQGNCIIGNYVRMHSNVHIGQLSRIDSFVWIFPYVVLTNDPTPPSENFSGVHICSFAIVATGSIVMPGITIEQDSLIGAGAIVTKDVHQFDVVVGNPAKPIADIRNIKNKKTGELVYPWREHFSKYMPWEGTDYSSWYSNLSIDEKDNFGIK